MGVDKICNWKSANSQERLEAYARGHRAFGAVGDDHARIRNYVNDIGSPVVDC
jgi:hypothetical protein